jgi:hypothetical protein
MSIDAAQQVSRNMIIEAEVVEELPDIPSSLNPPQINRRIESR